MGRIFLDRLHRAFGEHPNVGDIRGRGLFFGIELVRNRATKIGFDDAKNLPEILRVAAMEDGQNSSPGGNEVDGSTVPHIMMAPPKIVEEEHMTSCIEKLAAVFDRSLPAA
jgi:adenosylmethionine-8-amino-7-oxononanoate aminotransferase